ncbi:MAG: hypothetical protein ABUS54_10040 [Actinomycetota bacterium]
MLADDLDRIGSIAEAYAAPGERGAAVLAAEPRAGVRVYLCAYEAGEAHAWLAFGEDGTPLADRRLVREAAELAALAEITADNAGGDELDELRVTLRRLREIEHPEGIDDAVAAADAVAAVLEEEPRVATLEFVDRVGALVRMLEQALGTSSASPFATLMQQARSAVDELADDVDRTYKSLG